MGRCVHTEWTGEAAGGLLLIRRTAHIGWSISSHVKRHRESYGAERRVFVSAGVKVSLARIHNA